MYRHHFAFLVLVCFTIQVVPTGMAVAETKASLPKFVLEGTPYECGRQHGESARQQIQQLIRLWKADIATQFKTDPDDFIQRFIEQTDFRSAMKKWTAGLLDEIKGIADGAHIDFNTMFVFQFGDETWVRGDLVREHCTSVGFSRSGEQPTFVAQNLDLEMFRDGYQVGLHLKYTGSEVESLVVTNMGCIGWAGVNNRSIGVVGNTVMALKNAREGLPVAAVIRGVLMQKTEKDAVAFVQQVKHATGLNYVIGGPNLAYSFEASSNKVVRYRPNNQDTVVWHTNHPLANDDYTDFYKETLEVLKKKPATDMDANTRARLANLKRRIEQNRTAPRFDLIKEILASQDSEEHPICGTKGKGQCYTQHGFFSFSGIVMVLSPSNPQLFCTLGPPNRNEFVKFAFR